MEQIGTSLLYVLVLLFVTGGFYYHGRTFSFEISQINVFAIALFLIFLRFEISAFHRLIVWGASVNVRTKLIWLSCFFGVIFLGHWVRHMTFQTHAFDMSFEHQPLFFPLHPSLLHCDMCRMKTAFGEHMQWSYLPLSVITAPFRSDTWIFILQSLLVAIPLWIFIWKGPLQKYPDHQFWFFILFTLMAGFRSGLLWDFREDIIGLSLMLLGLTFLFRAQTTISLICFAIAMWSKENIPYVLALFGLVTTFRTLDFLTERRRLLFSAALLAISLATVIIENKWLIRHFMADAEGKNNVLLLFPGWGNSMSEFQRNVLGHPLQFIIDFGRNIFTQRSMLYIASVLAPWIVWGGPKWFWAIPSFFTLALNVLAVSPNQNSGSYHYELVMVPFFMWSVALSIREASPSRDQSPSGQASLSLTLQKRWILALLVAACFADRGPLFETTDRLFTAGHRIGQAWEMQNWDVDGEAPVAASGHFISHFSRAVNTRYLRIPQLKSSLPESTFLRAIAEFNPPRALSEHTRDIRDAEIFILDREAPEENEFARILDLRGTKKLAETDSVDGPVMYKLDRPFATWIQHALP